jgi:hypothetical protein
MPGDDSIDDSAENPLQQKLSPSVPTATDHAVSSREDSCNSQSTSITGIAAAVAIPVRPPSPPETARKVSMALPALNFKKVPQEFAKNPERSREISSQKSSNQEISNQETSSTRNKRQNNADFLDNSDAAIVDKRRKPPEASTLKPVAPAGQTSFIPGNKPKKEPTEAALKFMRWIQEGLSQGELPYNRADAMIHFVEEGMMLVSPVIFRKFAELFGESGDGQPSERSGGAIGTGIQRQVTNAGWHKVTGTEKKNIQKFLVAGHDGGGKKIISGVVILDPVRFVNPLPEINPSIVAFDKPLDSAERPLNE